MRDRDVVKMALDIAIQEEEALFDAQQPDDEENRSACLSRIKEMRRVRKKRYGSRSTYQEDVLSTGYTESVLDYARRTAGQSNSNPEDSDATNSNSKVD